MVGANVGGGPWNKNDGGPVQGDGVGRGELIMFSLTVGLGVRLGVGRGVFLFLGLKVGASVDNR